jgi:hypothetical protein
MRIANVFKIKLPVFMRLIRQTLRFAGNRIHLTASCSNFIDNSLLDVAP